MEHFSTINAKINKSNTRLFINNKLNSILSNEFNEKDIINLEISIYNWTIEYSDKNNILKNWENDRFKMLYLEKCRLTISLLTKDLIKIKKDILNNNYTLKDIPFKKPHEIHSNLWEDITEKYNKKYETAFEHKQTAMTDMFVCRRCKKNECSYYEIFSRKGDEGAVTHVKCLSCGYGWKF